MMPWSGLLALVQPHYAKGEMGRRPVERDILLRVYFLPQRLAQSDPGVEGALLVLPSPLHSQPPPSAA